MSSFKAPIALLAFFFLIFYYPLITGTAYLWEDVLEQHYPNIVYTMHSIRDFAIPHWNPFVFGGMPHMADMQTGIFYPPNWLLFALQSFTETGGTLFIVYIILHILILGIGTLFLFKSFGLSIESSLFVAIGVSFSGFVSTHVIHIMFLFVMAWFPFALLFLKKAFEEGSVRKLAIASLFAATSILGGYAQYTLFCSVLFFLYSLYFLLTAINKNNVNRPSLIRRHIAYFAIFIALSYGMALVQLLSSMELAQESVRSKMTWERSVEGSLSFINLISLLMPKFFGFVNGDGSGSLFWGGRGTHLFWETAAYIGIVPLLITIVAFKKLRQNKLYLFLISLSFVALLLMLGNNGPLYWFVFNFVPGFGSFRHPGRFSVVFMISMLPAAGIALDYFIATAKNGSAEEKKELLKKTLFVSIAFAIAIIFLGLALMPSGDVERTCAKNSMLTALLFTLFSFAAIWFLVNQKSSRLALMLLMTLLFGELYFFGSAFGRGKVFGKEAFSSNNQIDLLRAESEKNPFRFQGRIFEGEGKGVRLFPRLNLGSVYRIETVEGYNQLHLGRLSRFVHEVNPQKGMDLMNVRFRPRADGRGFDVAPDGSYRKRFMLIRNIKAVDSGDEAIRAINSDWYNPLVNSVVEGKLETNYGTDGIERKSNGVDSIRIVLRKSERIELEVTSSEAALLVTADPWFPAWKAFVNGIEKPILRTDFLFRGVEILKGESRVVFQYDSKAFSLGWKLSLFFLAITIAFLFFEPRKKF